MQVNDVNYRSIIDERKKVEAALARLKAMKCQISELRAQCEALKKQESDEQKGLTCSECGKLVEQGQEVTLKDTFGKVKGHYHRDCFKAIWLSQNWTFDYSSHGFLRMSGNDQ
jgi:hypothetical protein